MSAQQDLIEAQLRLKEAEAAAARENRDKKKTDLIKARAEARLLTREIQRERRKFDLEMAEGANAGERLAVIDLALANLICEEEFPTEQELQAIEDQRVSLLTERKSLLADGQARGQRIEQARDKIMAFDQRLVELRYAIRNLEVVVRGGTVGKLENSLSPVSSGATGELVGWVRPV